MASIASILPAIVTVVTAAAASTQPDCAITDSGASHTYKGGLTQLEDERPGGGWVSVVCQALAKFLVCLGVDAILWSGVEVLSQLVRAA